MTYRQAFLSLAVALCAVVAMANNLSHSDKLPPPLLSIESEPLALMYWEFHNSGWSGDDSSELAKRSIDRLRGRPAEPFEPSEQTSAGSTLLEPDSDPLAILYWAFLYSGHSPETSSNYTERIRRRVLGIEPEDPDSDFTPRTNCQVYPITIMYCENGQRKSKLTWIDAPCWEMSAPLCPAQLPQCPNNETLWYTLNLPCSEFPCSWVRVGVMTEVDCVITTVDCECFELDCEDVPNPQCCPLRGCGQIGAPCPDCS